MFQASSSRQSLSLRSKANENQVLFSKYFPPARRKMCVLFFLICALFYVAPIKNTLPVMLGILDYKWKNLLCVKIQWLCALLVRYVVLH